MEASYKKLRDGGWGIRTSGGVPDVGDTVEVVTKSGEAKQEEVSRIVWSGKNDDGNDASICEIVQTDRDGNKIQKPARQQQQGGGQGGGQQQQQPRKPQCKCKACGTTDAEKDYYCGDCVLTGHNLPSPSGAADDEIPF